MSRRDTIRVPADTLVIFEEVGIAISAGRGEPEHGSLPLLTINTEEAPPRDIAPDGSPILWVGLNDSDLYDRELAPLTDGQARRIASEWHSGQASALYALSSSGAIDDRTATEIRNAGELPGDSLAHDELQVLLTYVLKTRERGRSRAGTPSGTRLPPPGHAIRRELSRARVGRRVRTDPAQVGTPIGVR